MKHNQIFSPFGYYSNVIFLIFVYYDFRLIINEKRFSWTSTTDIHENNRGIWLQHWRLGEHVHLNGKWRENGKWAKHFLWIRVTGAWIKYCGNPRFIRRKNIKVNERHANIALFRGGGSAGVMCTLTNEARAASNDERAEAWVWQRRQSNTVTDLFTWTL